MRLKYFVFRRIRGPHFSNAKKHAGGDWIIVWVLDDDASRNPHLREWSWVSSCS